MEESGDFYNAKEGYIDGAKEGSSSEGDFFPMEKKFNEKLKSVAKLLFIVVCYGAAFLSLVQLGFWAAKTHQFNQIILPTDIFTWITEKWRHQIWWDGVTRAMLINCCLLFAFSLQHTLMTQRVLANTTFWLYLHHVYKIDRPLYVLATGLALQGVARLWQPVPVMIWTAPWLAEYFQIIHILSWISLYGTSLMLDMPDMVGFNQVVISSPNMTKKSPDLQMMYRTQRHMGFLSFSIILLIHPQMTLDRFLMTVGTFLYTYVCWRSPTCYEYACQMKSLKKRRIID